MGEVVRLRPRGSGDKAARAFAPIKPQHEIDTASATELRAALVRKLRRRFAVAAVACWILGFLGSGFLMFLGGYFTVFALFTRSIVDWVKGPVRSL